MDRAELNQGGKGTSLRYRQARADFTSLSPTAQLMALTPPSSPSRPDDGIALSRILCPLITMTTARPRSMGSRTCMRALREKGVSIIQTTVGPSSPLLLLSLSPLRRLRFLFAPLPLPFVLLGRRSVRILVLRASPGAFYVFLGRTGDDVGSPLCEARGDASGAFHTRLDLLLVPLSLSKVYESTSPRASQERLRICVVKSAIYVRRFPCLLRGFVVPL